MSGGPLMAWVWREYLREVRAQRPEANSRTILTKKCSSDFLVYPRVLVATKQFYKKVDLSVGQWVHESVSPFICPSIRP